MKTKTVALLKVSFYLFAVGNKNAEVQFETKSGILKAKKFDGKIALDLPMSPSQPVVSPDFEIDLLNLRRHNKMCYLSHSTNID